MKPTHFISIYNASDNVIFGYGQTYKIKSLVYMDGVLYGYKTIANDGYTHTRKACWALLFNPILEENIEVVI